MADSPPTFATTLMTTAIPTFGSKSAVGSISAYNGLKVNGNTAMPLSVTPNVATTANAYSTVSTNSPSDMRVKLSAQNDSVYGNGIISPLINTGGMLFPYTPTVSVEQSVDYATLALVHSNSDYHAYTRTPNVTFNVSGKFTFQNQAEGAYMLAAIHFLRTVSKMNFGANDPNAGTPPPVLTFSGYGTYMFNGVRVLLKSHSFSFDEHMDMITLNTNQGGTVKLPAMMTLTISLIAQQTPAQWMNNFTLDSYRSGQLLTQGGWF